MRLQKMLLLVFMLGLTSLIQAQSKSKPDAPFPSQEGKHTLSFYPLHLTYYFGFYSLNTNPPFPALGYAYHFKDDWALQAKFYFRQLEDPLFGTVKSHAEEKNIKLGIQYYCINRQLQLKLALSGYLEDRNYKSLDRMGNEFEFTTSGDNEIGIEFGLGLGYRLNEQARLTYGMAIRYGYIKGKADAKSDFLPWLGNPIESLGFEYTF